MTAQRTPDETAPDHRERSGARLIWAHLWRTALLLFTGFAASLAVALWGLGGTRGGLAKVVAVLAFFGPGAAVLFSMGLPRRSRQVLVVLAALTAVTVSAVVWQQAPIMPDRLAQVVHDVPVPQRATPTGEFSGGNSLCFDVCPSYTASFQIDVDQEAAISLWTDALAAAGYGVVRDTGPSLRVRQARPGVDLVVTFGGPPHSGGSARPPDTTPVSVTASNGGP